MRVLVCGDRFWRDYKKILHTLQAIHRKTPIDCVIEGGQRTMSSAHVVADYGADWLARAAAFSLGIPVIEFPANWTLQKLAAGPIRNSVQLKFGKPDLVLAFHSDLSKSKGTKDMVNKARKAKVPVKLIT